MTPTGRGREAPDELTDILERARIDYGIEIVDANRLQRSWGDHLRLVVTSKTGRFLLKERPWLLGRGEFNAHLAVQNHAHEREPGQAPRVLRTGDGWMSTSHGPRQFAMHEWVDPTNHEPHEVLALVRGFAELLNSLATMTRWPAGDWSMPRLRPAWCPDRPRLFNHYLQAWRAPAEGISPRAPLASVDALITAVGAEVARCGWDAFPAQCLHGDPSPFNALKRGPRICWIDFECARFGYRIWDLARLLVVCHVLTRPTEDVDLPTLVGRWPAAALRRSIAAFTEVTPLRESELRAFPHVLKTATAVVCTNELGLDDPGLRPPENLATFFERLRSLLAEPLPIV